MIAVVISEEIEDADRAARRLARARIPTVIGPTMGARPCDDQLVVLVGVGASDLRVQAIGAFSDEHPGALIVATMPDDAPNGMLRRAMKCGALGVVLDGHVDRSLAVTVRGVIAGQLVVPATLRTQIEPPSMSFREKQILKLVAMGLTNRQIADRLFIAESTVKTHLSSSYAKLDVRSRAEAAARILDPEWRLGEVVTSVADLPETIVA